MSHISLKGGRYAFSATMIMFVVLSASTIFFQVASAEEGVDASAFTGHADNSTKAKTYSLDVLAPNGGEVFHDGASIDILWETGGTGAIPYVRLAFSTDGGESYTTFETLQPNDGRYTWIVPDVTD